MQEENNYILNEPDVEYEDLSGVLMEKPFDPNKIDITTKTPSIDILIKRLKAEPSEIDLSPAFQRHSDLWDEEKQSRLIESILIKFPLPAFYFDGSDNNKWLVVDGLQRLSTLRNFVISRKLKLKGMEFLKQLNGMKFDELPRSLQRQIEETQITAYIINDGTPEEVKFNIFQRINTGGLTLNSQEIRHALNQGIPATFIAELAELEEFKIATDEALKPKRMLDREFVTRFLAFYLHPYQEYVPDLDTYMNSAMGELKKMDAQQREKIKTDFIQSVLLAKSIFGEWAFRKADKYPEKRKPINKALFEVWSVSLAKLNEKDRMKLENRKQILFDKSIQLVKEDTTFFDSITTSTGNKSSVAYRFSNIEKIIQETLEQ
ncbi:MAG TPA: DUF262 domain-containing protein [Ginsengibacter sp.]|nr:DUF262 domain-containing protein [Chitinophagaceae bacterium]HRP16521.1 DUF262 domain-containing protein [Ginsengibacter sp.]HRP43599.1 DUF262 domain-containing protein [Ginsengibacter sp.]